LILANEFLGMGITHSCAIEFPENDGGIQVLVGLTPSSKTVGSWLRAPVAGLLNKRLMLSSSFRCDQIYKYEIYNFGHTLLCYLSPT
jgi:hypothetical protein